MIAHPQPHHAPATLRAFTLIELIAILFVIALIVGILLPAMGPRRHCCSSRQLKDSTQIRGILQSMVVFGQNNGSKYPLPSRIDPGSTVAALGEEKNTTGNILSVLIYNGNISPEICINPAESNTGQVQAMTDYQFTDPAAAINPSTACWDPRFRGTPIDAPVGNLVANAPANQSYAHTIPIGKRLEQWADTFSTTEAVLGNRGPQYAPNDSAPGVPDGKWKLPNAPTGTGSNTLLIHGPRTTWEGNIAFNDGHVEFVTKPAPDALTYTRIVNGRKTATPDNLFVNESDELGGDSTPNSFNLSANAYLRPIAERTTTSIRLWID